jgi:hypothetical protein
MHGRPVTTYEGRGVSAKGHMGLIGWDGYKQEIREFGQRQLKARSRWPNRVRVAVAHGA